MKTTAAVAAAVLLLQAAQLCAADTITANMGYTIDLPLVKKYSVMNSGLINADRYNDTILQSLGAIKARSLVTDIFMGTSNTNASFRDVIAGNGGTAANGGVTYDFTQLDALTTGLGEQLVLPYYAVTYAPTAFQPPVTAANSSGFATCLGFEAYAPNHYACTPMGYNGFDNCWKCPPKNADGSGYSQFEAVMQAFAAHQNTLNVSSYLQVWNEPDLTDYFNENNAATSATFFAGNSEDYTDMYLAAQNGLRAGDEHAIVGGPGVSFWVSKNPGVQPWDDLPSASNLVLLAVNESLPLDFISFHVVTQCTDPSTCNPLNNGGQPTFVVRAQFARYALTQPVAVLDGGRFNTTEIHCTEYFSGTLGYQYGLPFTASPALGILMLNDFVAYLNQTDVSQITWAQYMEPSQQNGTGLVDLYGNARPAWHTFRFWGDLPVERVSTNTTNAELQSVAGFNRFECHGSVLIWNNGSTAVPLSVNILQLPYQSFTVQVYQLNDNSLPGPGFEFEPTNTLINQTLAADGSYSLNLPNFTLPESGIVYVNITGNDCTLTPSYPSGRVLKTYSYYDKRPAMTLKYGEFDQRTWTAYVGMGNETVGSAIAGAVVLVEPDVQLNITLDFINVPAPPNSPAILLRVDYWDEATKSYPAANSFAFYQTGASANYTFPDLFGSTQPIPAANHVPVNLANFGFQPNTSPYPVPAGWNGQMSMTVMLQNGPANSIVRAYFQQNANQPVSVAAATNVAVASSTAG